MTSAWCPFCSHNNPYETIRPKRCAKCDKDMTTAFRTAPLNEPKPPTMTTAREEYRPPEPVYQSPLRRPKPVYGTYEGGSSQPDNVDERYSRDEVDFRASQMSQTLAGAFNFSLNDEGTSMKLGSLSNVRGAFTQVDAAEKSAPKKTRARKGK